MKILTLILSIFISAAQVQPLTEAELKSYIHRNHINAVDYKMIDDTSAVILELLGPRATSYKVYKQRDNSISPASVSISWQEDEDGVSVKSTAGYLCVVVHDKAVVHNMEYFDVYYMDDEWNRKKDRFELNKKRGTLVEISSKYEKGGAVSVYGSDGYSGDFMFYH